VTESPPDDPDDLVPISVRLGTVVPPEDPEDWTRPLTWVAALGMLAAPALAFAWFLAAAPLATSGPVAVTWAVAVTLVVGAAATGGTQLGRLRAFTGTLGAALLSALLVVLVGAATAGERQVGAASPTLVHALAAAVAGVCGAAPAAVLGGLAAGWWPRSRRALAAGALGALVTAEVLPRLFGG
jgi:hypothetical protein